MHPPWSKCFDSQYHDDAAPGVEYTLAESGSALAAIFVSALISTDGEV